LTAGPVGGAERHLVRLGLDLHDGPVQEAAALLADLRLIRGNLGDALPAAAAASLADIEGRLDELHEELRDLAHSLEARALVERPLVELLEREVASFRSRNGIELDLDDTGDVGELSPSQRTAVARIVQEALRNVGKHSGASRAQVTVHAGTDEAVIRVRDDGCGFDPGQGRRDALGLRGIRERVRFLDGSFELDTRHGGPTTLEARLPRWSAPDDPPAR
jgi:signal transduction histidine kinase